MLSLPSLPDDPGTMHMPSKEYMDKLKATIQEQYRQARRRTH